MELRLNQELEMRKKMEKRLQLYFMPLQNQMEKTYQRVRKMLKNGNFIWDSKYEQLQKKIHKIEIKVPIAR